MFNFFRNKLHDPEHIQRLLEEREERERREHLEQFAENVPLYEELYDQCMKNVRDLRGRITQIRSSIKTPIGPRKTKAEVARLERQIEWLQNKLEEEEFMSGYYGYLKDYPYF